ncbi:hypothetical protein LINGRAHAP2_LOCUS8596 [Linum grandiflorum]
MGSAPEAFVWFEALKVAGAFYLVEVMIALLFVGPAMIGEGHVLLGFLCFIAAALVGKLVFNCFSELSTSMHQNSKDCNDGSA